MPVITKYNVHTLKLALNTKYTITGEKLQFSRLIITLIKTCLHHPYDPDIRDPFDPDRSQTATNNESHYSFCITYNYSAVSQKTCPTYTDITLTTTSAPYQASFAANSIAAIGNSHRV